MSVDYDPPPPLFGFALTGLRYAFRTQANFRIHIVISLAVIAIGLGVPLGPIEWAVLIVTMMLVLSAELMNTALEATLDRVSVEQHPLAKVAGTTAAGAVSPRARSPRSCSP